MTNTEYLKTFFEEKKLPEALFEVDSPNGTANIISSEVVIEHIMLTEGDEQEQIVKILRAIDFKNGDVNHFLRYLAQALAQDM